MWILVSTGVATLVLALSLVVSVALSRVEPLIGGLALFAAGMAAVSVGTQVRAHRVIDGLSRVVGNLATNPLAPIALPPDLQVPDLAANMRLLARKLGGEFTAEAPSSLVFRANDPVKTPMTRSGLYESPSGFGPLDDPSSSGGAATTDMVSRLHPETLRWLDSSLPEQQFLGLPLSALRDMSFLDLVHPDHRDLAREQLNASLSKGEAHGLIYRIRTAHGEKAIEMNVSARYGADMRVTHLRCHVTDVTAKLQASRELRRRTRELTHANEQLRHINLQLSELKDRYSDLYQNAPAMYLSVDPEGRILECNDTLLRTLGYNREELIGRPVAFMQRGNDASATCESPNSRPVGPELETTWRKADGSAIDVWVTSTAVAGTRGEVTHYRSVAQDITLRRRLEAELKASNQNLAVANSALSRRNRELDEFTHLVSHDLQEPLRTLIGFSDFLAQEYGDRLDDRGQEYVRYLVEASRRLRSLIHDLLSLSVAGRVTGDLREVALDDLVSVVRADLAELIRSRAAEVRTVGALPKVWGDRVRLGQLLGNLVSNGLKYNKSPRPVVEVGTCAADGSDWAALFVRDNGIGVDPQHHESVFQIFRRLHTREDYPGTGAGLAICQKIVQAHGGRIWLESQPGEGSTFYFTLPRRPPELRQPTAEAVW
jgi:PAS domain S-box-containing protein